MRSFEEIICDCIINKDEKFDIYNQLINELLELNDISNLITKLSKIYHKPNAYIKASINPFLKEHSFKQLPPQFDTFNNALNNYIKENLSKSQRD